MSDALRYSLAASIFVAVLFMIGVQVHTRKKINKIKDKYTKEEDDVRVKLKLVGTRESSSIDNESLEYIIQSILRNGYATTSIIGSIGKFEKENIEGHANQKIVKGKADFIIARLSNDVANDISNIYKQLNKGGIIAIVDAPKKDSLTKDIMNTAKYSAWRHEHQKIGDGMILIAN